MKHLTCTLPQKVALIISSIMMVTSSLSLAVVGSSSQFVSLPPITTFQVPGQVMLTMSNDHQLHYKAYTDWDDMTGDGIPDKTFVPSVSYYGYFDPQKCYDYSIANKRFEPKAVTTDPNRYCDGVSGHWSGNFLNWASMTRMDSLRKVFYGGMRSTDSSETVLERSFLTTDAHSFAKYYDGADINKLTEFSGVSEITLCNTTYDDGSTTTESQFSTQPPLIRVAEGDFRFWAANERWQCTWDNEHGNNTSDGISDPNKTNDGLGQKDYIARVLVCDSSLLGSENCKQYPNGNYKPIGLLHTFGEDGRLLFGLLTGSYQKNKSGGVVRKNISSFADEIDANTGIYTNTNGIVSTINKLRIARYGHGDNGIYNNTDSCSWGKSSFTEGTCSNWGNPVSEMYQEAVRYFAGLNANPNFAATDTNYIPGLGSATWSDPLNVDNRCASCNIVMVNASGISYDDDGISMADLPKGAGGATTAAAQTDSIGEDEGIHGKSFFVGENGSDNNQLCTPKTVNNLSTVKGICPDTPRLSGTYNIAGIARWAHVNDIRTDLTDAQKITTYAVALSPAVPAVSIPDTNGDIIATLLPACRNTALNPDANCAIVDFKILDQDIAGGTGTFAINWEDSEQGGDYDQDMQGMLSYQLIGSTKQIRITTNVVGKSTGYAMGFGYTISGTDQDGFHAHSGINGFDFNDPQTGIIGCNNCQHTDAATSQTYTLGTSSASLLKAPLWYAAKYGGFRDIDGDGALDANEWDTQDLNGNNVADGIPDAYFPITNPNQLEARLSRVFSNILNRVASGTAAAVVSNSANGVGAIYQALYFPKEIKNAASGPVEATWLGELHAIFIDDLSQFREDSASAGTQGQLDDCTTDKIVTIQYVDHGDGQKSTDVQRYDCDTSTGLKTTASGSAVGISELQTIWSARKRLSAVADVVTQRSYGANAASGRYIITAIDGDADGNVTGTDVTAFTDTNLITELGSNFPQYLNASDTAEATKIVQYVRGQEITGMRNRTLPDGNTDEVWRLGDIIHSTPVTVGTPADSYHVKYGDTSYRDYYDRWQNRRQMVYVGANDGMLHAFNGGVYNDANKAFQESGHALGSEMWAYVPYNLLPHLRWLTENNYPHVYYMDGPPVVFDANIFDADTDHVNGWGTILVAGMRLGGAELNIDHDADNSTPDAPFRSAYIIFDVTNPETGPKLLGEIQVPDASFSLSRPTLVVKRSPSDEGSWLNPTDNDWYLAFGSGPTDLATIQSTSTPSVYVYQLDATSSGLSSFPGSPVATLSTSVGNSFVGELSKMDWNYDFNDDVIYFGLAGQDTSVSPAVENGRLMRLRTVDSGWSLSTMLNPARPFVSAPSTWVDSNKDHWVNAGTGRLFVEDDKPTSLQQYFFGLKEPKDSNGDHTWATLLTTNLHDSTTTKVYTDTSNDSNLVENDVHVSDGTTFSDLQLHIKTEDGWMRKLPTYNTDPSMRNVTRSLTAANFVFFTTYTPNTDACEAEGTSNLYALYTQTGTAYPFSVIGSTTTNGKTEYLDNIEIGPGLSSEPVIHYNTGGDPGSLTIITQDSGGGLTGQPATLPPAESGRRSWRELTPD